MVQARALKQKLLIIAGPTCVGKTKLAMNCYDLLNCELISADSMQIYRGCDIATAKISKSELKKYPHKNINLIDFNQSYSVAEFKAATLKQIDDISEQGKLPILVGGTGLYIESLLFTYDFNNCSKNDELRKKYSDLYDEVGGEELIAKIRTCNPSLAEDLHPNNKKLILRKLEIALLGETNDSSDKKNFENSNFDYQIVFLNKDREQLYSDINARIDIMVQSGLIEEAKKLFDYERQNNVTLQVSSAIGYKELYPYFNGEVSLNDAIEKIKQHTRNYAKRQITWYKRYTSNIEWVNNNSADNYKNLLNYLTEKYADYLKK